MSHRVFSESTKLISTASAGSSLAETRKERMRPLLEIIVYTFVFGGYVTRFTSSAQCFDSVGTEKSRENR